MAKGTAAGGKSEVRQLCVSAQTTASAEPAYMAELEQLSQLKEQGILSEEEFAAKKQQILGLEAEGKADRVMPGDEPDANRRRAHRSPTRRL